MEIIAQTKKSCRVAGAGAWGILNPPLPGGLPPQPDGRRKERQTMKRWAVIAFVCGVCMGSAPADSADTPLLVKWQENPVAIVQRDVRLMNVSAYTASVRECGKADGITASGTRATEGRTVAADHLPFGTVVRINGQEYIVEDRFGGGYADRLDIYMEHEADAWDFGRQTVEVEIVR